jgi:integrase
MGRDENVPRRSRARQILYQAAAPVEMTETSVRQLVDRFLAYVRHERGLADNTQQAYARDLVDFARWLAGRSPLTLSVNDLGDYLAWLADRSLARASIARQAATLRSFYAFLQLEGLLEQSPAERLMAGRRDDTIPATLSPAQVDRLLDAPSGRSPSGIRDRAVLELLYATGCRASEVSTLRLADLRLAESFCTCRGKGSKERVVPLGQPGIRIPCRGPALGRPLVTGQQAFPDADLGDRPRACDHRRTAPRYRSSYAPSQLCHPSRGGRGGPAACPGDARSCEHCYHATIHPCRCITPQKRARTVPSTALTGAGIHTAAATRRPRPRCREPMLRRLAAVT